MKGKKKMHIGWIIVLAVVLIIAAVIGYCGIRNGNRMNSTVDAGLRILEETYTVTETDCGEYSSITVYGIMKFHVSRYDVEGLGSLCIMKMNMGLMQMATFVLTPYEKQMPLLSVDYVYTFGSRKAIVECYDLVSDPGTEEYRGIIGKMQAALGEFSDLADYEAGSAWYDSLLTAAVHKEGKAAQDTRFSALFAETVRAYAEASSSLPVLNGAEAAEKLAITEEYCNNMIEKGGLSTNVFKKALGEDTTRDFFRKVFFGTESRGKQA